MSNVILYESTTTDFFNQGLGPLTEAKDPKVTEVGNGEFYLELDYPTTGRLFNQLKNGNLIKSDAGHELKDQRFEIKRVVKSMKQGYVSVYAEHISNQALDIALPANVTLSGSAQTALQQAQSNGLGTFKPFTMSSDITTTNSTTLSIKEFKNLKQALGGVEGSILDTWGGEYKFDNYHISLFKKRGRQANAMIAYGRNLVDLEQEENIMNTFTSVYPYAVWRDKEGAEHIIEGSVIHSEHADKYPHHKVLPVDFTLEVEDDTKPTATMLNQLATSYIENNDIGVPEVSIRLTHLDLSKTLDYKEYAEVEKLNVFDEVKIYFADFDINTTAKIVRTVWNVNLERYDEIEVGKVRASLSDRINTIGKQISEARKEAQDARNVSMVAANGVNMVFFGPDEPTATKVGDRWFMEDGQYTISKVWDGVIWRVVSDPRLSDQNAQLISEQKDQIDDMKLDVDYSYDQLQQTIANSGFTDLNTAFGNVKTLSEQAESNAYNAMQQAIGNASLIDNMESSIISVNLDIDDIEGTLQTTVSRINDLDGDFDFVQTQWTQTFENFETSVTGSDGRLTLAEQFLDGFRNTAFDPSTGQLSLTEQTIAGLQSTVSDPVNGLETRVTTIANGFQVLSNDVDGLEAQLSVTNENVLARVQKGDVYSQLLIDSRNILFDANDRIMLSANKVVIDATQTFIPGAVIENASIDSAKISKIDGNVANIININVDNIVGNRSEFIQSYWNDITSSVQISSAGLITTGTNTKTIIESGSIYNEGQLNGELAQVFLEQGSMLLSQGLYEGALSPRNGLILQNGGTMGIQANFSGLSVFTPDGDIFFGVDGIQLNNGAFIKRLGPVSDGMEWSVPGFMHFSAWGSRAFSVYSDAVSFYRTLSTEGNTIAARNVDANNAYDVLELNAYRTDLGDFLLGKYSSGGRYVRSTAIREATTSSGANVSISSSGDIRTSVSARKYKDDIKTVTNQLDLGKSIMSLEIKSWYDKAEMKSSVNPLNRYYGLIAEEVAEAGLTNFVDYVDGEIEGIYYDRLWIPLVPVVADHNIKIENLTKLASKAYLKAGSNEERIEVLEAELKLLKGER
ncbi:phage tail spike protein [Marinilactibacillus psychrotolerans]|uniref:Peptidase S74 domain-containing protein n=1 Tax=Marinilactibacillus psychrotolerans TaxID=191770 RepID=A0AAV3WV85_9LACT|nr:phage tail spike protein [Marinilactibacillus psychrotolerans]GEL67258.1 hypothetical protein MPS01_14130 [Marinilactibacillus psychrotolerans]GEQ36062.1 hypothetical protein M132T_15700 [Marinilactibacillus psychrotolerans]SDC61990.1 phage minor structural protein, N-terminal region [Marinilactibacillus psychrotolerans]